MVGDFWNGTMRTSVNFPFHKNNENSDTITKINFLDHWQLTIL